MTEISRFYGIAIGMCENREQKPHFHIFYNDYQGIMEVESGLVEGRFPPRVLQLVGEWLPAHREELLENWKIPSGHALKKIAPLD